MSLRSPVPGFKNFKRLDPQNLCQFYTGDDTQLVLKISRKEEVARIVEKFKSEMVAFHCRSDGRQLMPVDPNNKIVVHEIPRHLHDVVSVYDWVVDNCPPITADRLGTIAANDEMVAVNMPHVCGDGRYLVGVIDHINDPTRKLTSQFPTPSIEIFAKELKSVTDPKNVWTDVGLTRIKEKNPRSPDELRMLARMNAKEFKCYNPATGRFKQMTEALWTSVVLSVATHFGGSDKLSPMTCVDMRAYTSRDMKKDLTFCNVFAVISVEAGKNWKSGTLGECYKLLRDDLNKKLAQKAYLNYVKAPILTGGEIVPPGQPIAHSHVGVVELKDPIVDAFMSNIVYFDPFTNMVPILTYSLVDKARDRNELVAVMRYGANGVTEGETKLMLRSIEHALKTYTPNMPMTHVLSDLECYQKALKADLLK